MKRIILLFIVITTLLVSVVHTPPAAGAERLPLRVQIMLAKVFPLLEKEKFSEAVQLLSEFREKRRSPEDEIYNHPEINFTMGNCYAMLGQLQKARDSYRIVVKSDAGHLRGWQNLAKTEYELESYLAASNAFFTGYRLTQQTEQVEPKYLYYSAITLLMAEQYGPCLEKFDLLLQRHPESLTLQWKENLVYAFLHADKAKKALPYMVELAEGFSGEKQQRWQELLLQQYMSLDMYDKALSLVNRLTRRAPTLPVWWKGLTHIHLHKGNYKKALAALTIYSYLTPMTEEEHKLLADLYLQQGIPEKAVINYERCTASKADKQAVLCLIRAYRSIDRLELALEKLLTFADLLGDQELAMERGEILYSMKQYHKAAGAYEKAAALKGKNKARASLMAGYSYWQVEEFDKAISMFSSAAKVKRYTKEANNAIAQLESIRNINR